MSDIWGGAGRSTLLPRLNDTYQDFSQMEINVFKEDKDCNVDRVKMPVILQGVRISGVHFSTKIGGNCTILVGRNNCIR